MNSRTARPDDVDAVTTTIALAFRDDPVWGPALVSADGGTDHLLPFWRFFVEGAVGYGTVSLVDGPDGEAATVAVWLPPGADELTPDQERDLDALLVATLSPERYAAYEQLYSLFDDAHPEEPAHMYLSLLATHPDHRGQGIGQRLLAEDLARFDADGLPAYLESTNPANDHRYARAGFRPVDRFRSVIDGAPVTTMWRDPASRG
ncbi:ribosomal protein S18 acetylase RimI-like enzyme [Leifsonia sp. EB41]|uniref:GNAT family N-acetyltransferase n=1 Tax=Leifsonia sp. EB41 TaxID=3156260 RepID=UPI0035178B1B